MASKIGPIPKIYALNEKGHVMGMNQVEFDPEIHVGPFATLEEAEAAKKPAKKAPAKKPKE
jgi:hypothetical protein